MPGIGLDFYEKAAASSLDFAADFLISGYAYEREKIAIALSKQVEEAREADATASRGAAPKDMSSAVPVDERADEEDEDDTKSASLSDCLLKIARNMVLPTTLAAMIAAKGRNAAAEADENRNGA